MASQTVRPESGDRTDVRPSSQDRCAECRDTVGNEWVYYRQGTDDPSTLVRHFGGVIKSGPVGRASAWTSMLMAIDWQLS
jgi:hypothetical protein